MLNPWFLLNFKELSNQNWFGPEDLKVTEDLNNMNKKNTSGLLCHETLNLLDFYYIIAMSWNFAFKQGCGNWNYQPEVMI